MAFDGPSLGDELLADFGQPSEFWGDSHQISIEDWYHWLEPAPIQDESSKESAAGSDTLPSDAKPELILQTKPLVSKSDALELPLPMMKTHDELLDEFVTYLGNAEEIQVKQEEKPQQSSAEKSTALDVNVIFAENNTIPVKQFTPTVETAPLNLSVKSGTKKDEDQAPNCEEKSEPPKETQPIAPAFKESTKRRKDYALKDALDSKFVPATGTRDCKVAAQLRISNILKPRK